MRLQLPRFSTLYPIFALILAAALALGRYSYIKTRQLADQSENSLGDTNRVLGEQMLERIDNFIVDSDRSLLDIVDLEHLSDFSRRWTEIVRLSQPVEAAIVLDENEEILRDGYVSKRPKKEALSFKDLFTNKILPELHLKALKVDLHKHLHLESDDGHDYLISFMKREQQATPTHPARFYYVVLKISLDYLVKEFFNSEFEKLVGKEQFAIVDARGNIVFGAEVRAPKKLLFEKTFPTTLYNWRLEMAPLNAARLAAEAQKSRRAESILIGLMVATILVGIAFLLYAVSKERRANQLKSEFISNVSHELKTPLSLIRMFGELLALGKVKSEETGREYAEIITRESERLSRLIDNVLDFSRIERGKASYDFQTGDLSEVVARAIDVYRHRFEREGVQLGTEIEETLPDTQFDESAMTLVLLNLLDNAFKYGGERGRIVVGLKRDRGRIRLSVRDFGPGIAADEQRRIFDRFYRSRSARTQNARGSGIGLSLVKHIAEAHGGRVTVESVPGQGATFIVTIPIVEPEGGPQHRAPAEEAA